MASIFFRMESFRRFDHLFVKEILHVSFHGMQFFLILPKILILLEEKVAAIRKLSAYSPKVMCGFDPCQKVGCLENKGAICVTDFECNPTFFDDHGNVLKGCKGKMCCGVKCSIKLLPFSISHFNHHQYHHHHRHHQLHHHQLYHHQLHRHQLHHHQLHHHQLHHHYHQHYHYRRR